MPASQPARPRALWRSGLALALLQLCSCTLAEHAAERQALLTFKDGIRNFEEVQAAWSLSGWCTKAGGDEACTAPLCTWGGVECDGYHVHKGNFVTSLRLTCKDCEVPLQGQLRPGLHRLQHLEYLHLEGNQLTGTLPPEWGEPGSFPELLEFNVNDNQLTGNMPETWAVGPAFEMLADLQMAGNRFSGTFPAGFAVTNTSFVSVMSFSFANNQFSGTLPNYVNGMITMAVAAMQNNRFTGTLPPEWGLQGYWWNSTLNNTQALEYLFLHGNNLTGGIPDQWAAPGSFTVLRQLTLSDNPGLGGSLPEAWGNSSDAMQALENFNCSKCGLTGTLPPWGTEGGLQNLRVLTLTDNSLSGTIPASWTGLASLDTVTIQPGNSELCPTPPAGATFDVCNSIDLLCDGRQELPSNSSYCTASQAGTAAGGGGSDGGGFPVAAVAVPVCLLCAVALGLAGLVWRRRRRRAAAKGGAASSSKRAVYKDAESGLCYDAAGMPLPPGDGSDGGALEADRDAGVTTAQSGSNGSAAWLPRSKNHSTELEPLPSDSNISFPNRFAPASLHHTSSTDRTNASSNNVGSGAEGGAAGNNLCFSSRELELSDWEIRPEEIQILKRQDGSDWQLGSGGFGTVYKALRNGVQPVAVKALGSANAKASSSHSEFAREISILRACRDTNILQFQGACFQDKRTLLVTEYMEGGNLAHNLRNKKVSWYRRGKKIALDVARALVYLHARKIVHLDIKSANVLLTRDGTAKVGDVGMAKIMAGDYVSGVVGTLAWSAPELLMGQRCTAKADVYSFGVVLWEICTGELPVRGQLREPRVPGECPSEVLSLVYSCLSPDPAARPTSTELVEQLLQSPSTPNPSLRLPADAGGAGTGCSSPSAVSEGGAAASSQVSSAAAGHPAAQHAGHSSGGAPDASCTPSGAPSSGGQPAAPPLRLVRESPAGRAQQQGDGDSALLRDLEEEEALEEDLIEELVSESAPNSGTYHHHQHLSGGSNGRNSGELQRRLVLPPAGSLSTASPFMQAAPRPPPASPFAQQ